MYLVGLTFTYLSKMHGHSNIKSQFNCTKEEFGTELIQCIFVVDRFVNLDRSVIAFCDFVILFIFLKN